MPDFSTEKIPSFPGWTLRKEVTMYSTESLYQLFWILLQLRFFSSAMFIILVYTHRSHILHLGLFTLLLICPSLTIKSSFSLILCPFDISLSISLSSICHQSTYIYFLNIEYHVYLLSMLHICIYSHTVWLSCFFFEWNLPKIMFQFYLLGKAKLNWFFCPLCFLRLFPPSFPSFYVFLFQGFYFYLFSFVCFF